MLFSVSMLMNVCFPFFFFQKGERKVTFKVNQKIKDASVTFGLTLHISGWYMNLTKRTNAVFALGRNMISLLENEIKCSHQAVHCANRDRDIIYSEHD